MLLIVYKGGGRQNRRATTSRINHRTTSATIGLKSNIPKVGSTRRSGASTGSVIWLTNEVMLMSRGCGLLPAKGAMNERITRANMTTVRSVIMKLTIPTKRPLPYPSPSRMDFR